ncbi:MAG: N-acyl-L-homoserine lactone synthetase [Alphaproteobacteria bacterium]|jgi:N-acyl-L-homoserine lactone synthetase
MLILVNQHNMHLYSRELESMFQLRKKVFIDKLGWDIEPVGDMEIDQFDTCEAHYLIYLDKDSNAVGSTRLIPTTEPYILGDIFSSLVEIEEVPRCASTWETTRFCADRQYAPMDVSCILMAGMIEFAYELRIKNYVSVTDVRLEKQIQRCGWTPLRLGSVQNINGCRVVGNRFMVRDQFYQRLTSKCQEKREVYIQNLTTLSLNINKDKVA